MREVMAYRDARQKEFAEHPFFQWLHSDRVSIEERLNFAPMGALFIMQFRDMSRWVLRFPQPRNEFEWVINHGTYEDEKHSRLFLETWREQLLDERLGWKASDVLWWCFLSPDQEVFRLNGIEFISLSVEDGGDPLIRFGHHEGGEATGHVGLGNTSKVATELSKRTGLAYRYWGSHHLDLETGHVGNIEGVFEEVTLDPARRTRAIELCGRIFDVFDRVFDAFLAYAHDYLEKNAVPRRPNTVRRASEEWAAPPLAIRPVDHRDEIVYERLCERKARVAQHPFYAWLRADNGLSARQKLQRFIPMWVIDILGYRDLNRYALPYPLADDPAKEAINLWANRLSAHSDMFMTDWDALGLDDLLGFTASQTFEFLFLDDDMDLHREHMIEFVKLAVRYTDPAVRWWTMAALESTGEQFFAHTKPLACAVETEIGARLDYLSGRHDAPLDATNTGGAQDGSPVARLTAETVGVALNLVDQVFDSIESQLWLSLAIARANKFDVP
jgi:hypothetical protein